MIAITKRFSYYIMQIRQCQAFARKKDCDVRGADDDGNESRTGAGTRFSEAVFRCGARRKKLRADYDAGAFLNGRQKAGGAVHAAFLLKKKEKNTICG